MKKDLLTAALLFIAITSCAPEPTNLPEPEISPTLTSTSTTVITVTPTILPSPTPTPVGGSSGLILYVGSLNETDDFSTSLHKNNFINQQLVQIPGFTDQILLGISPDGKKVLTNKVSGFDDLPTQLKLTLMVSNLDGSTPVILSERIVFQNDFYNSDAFWLSDSDSILYFNDDNGIPQVFIIDSDGSNNKQITHVVSGVRSIIPVLVDNGIYFSDYNDVTYWISVENGEYQQVEARDNLAISPDGNYLTWQNVEYPVSQLHIFQMENKNEMVIPINDILQDGTVIDQNLIMESINWLPNSQEFIVNISQFSEGEEVHNKYLMNLKGEVVKEIEWKSMISIDSWSPDGNQFTFTDDEGIWVMDLTTMNVENIVPFRLENSFYYYAYWLK